MPNTSWQTVPIGSVIEGLYDGPHATPQPAESGPVFLGIKNITDDGLLDLSTIRHIDPKDYPKWTKRVEPKEGDIVFTYEATLHRYAIIPRGFRGCLGRRMALIRTDETKALGKFLHFAFYGNEWRQTIEANIWSGATVDRIPLTNFPDFPITLPPLPVQRRIAEVLSAYDDLIEVNTRRIKALEEMARRTYEEWFVHYRFPGGDGTKPREWEEVTLGQIAAVNPTQIKPSAAPDKVSYIDIASVSPGRIDSITPMAFSEAPGRARRIVQRGDTIWSCVRPNRRSHALIGTIPANTLASTGFAVLRPEKVPASWLYLAVTTDLFVSYLENSATGAAYPAVKKEDFTNAQSDLPPLDILEAFELLAGPILELVDSLLQQNTNLRAQRDLLLPRLVSGAIDVSDAEIIQREAAEVAAE